MATIVLAALRREQNLVAFMQLIHEPCLMHGRGIDVGSHAKKHGPGNGYGGFNRIDPVVGDDVVDVVACATVLL